MSLFSDLIFMLSALFIQVFGVNGGKARLGAGWDGNVLCLDIMGLGILSGKV